FRAGIARDGGNGAGVGVGDAQHRRRSLHRRHGPARLFRRERRAAGRAPRLGRPALLGQAGRRPRKRQSGPLTVAAELDRIYLDSAADCVIDDPGLARRIRIEKRGSRSTVVWNPWRDKAAALGDMGGDETYLGMLCVESANAADDVATVAPGGEHRLWVRYGVERD
ncbi:aldose epimerase family protein, partial [Methylogaea oryzae]|uniref:aldose epimerase family protein n=1 Tax=Methylogaea oryzae TaxID=1295382 RepID=UPI00402B8431